MRKIGYSNRPALVVALIGVLVLDGCLHSPSRATSPVPTAGITGQKDKQQSPKGQSGNRHKRYKEYKRQRNWAVALKTIRQEVAAPATQDSSYLAGIYIEAIRTLEKYASAHGVQEGFDEEATRYHEEGIRHAPNDRRMQVLLHTVLSRYYSNSRRVDRVLPYMRAAVKTIQTKPAVRVSKDNAYLVAIYGYGIRTLGKHASAYGLQDGFDEEATHYYAEGLRFAADDPQDQAVLHRALSLYYPKTGRPGRGQTYIQKELELWKRVNNTFQVIVTYDAMASFYGDMGETALEKSYRKKALEVGAGYFVFGAGPSDPKRWVAYKGI